jgi:hypothetical protein
VLGEIGGKEENFKCRGAKGRREGDYKVLEIAGLAVGKMIHPGFHIQSSPH